MKKNRRTSFLMVCLIHCVWLTCMPMTRLGATGVNKDAVDLFQGTTVSGKVTDKATGEGIPGVTVLEKGTSNGTVTDLNGNYRLTVGSSAVLVFSSIGYTTMEFDASSQSALDVQLSEDVQSLDEVVVIGYGEVEKGDVTGSVVSFDSKQLEKVNKVDALSAIQGQVPGVMVQRADGKPGSGGFNVRVRGASTINSTETVSNGGYTPGQNPLFIVDGIFVDDISFLNPADIASMNVLKDASATAIYGARGTNGVVIIQTKKGQSGELTVRYNNYVGVNEAYHLPPIFDTPEYVEFLRDVVVGNWYASEQDGNFAQYSRDNVDLTDYLSDEELQNIADGVSTDWIDLISQNGFQTNHTIDMSGGNEKTTYAVGFGYTRDVGTTKGEDYTRYNLRGSMSNDLTNWLNLSYNNYVTISKQNAGSSETFRSAYRLKPLGRAYNDDGSLRFYPTEKETQITNPLFDVDNVVKETKYLNYIGDIALKLTPLEGLSITTKYSPNIRYTRYGEYRGLYSKSSVGVQTNTRAQVENYVDFSYTWDNIVSYSKTINASNKIDATFVYSQYERRNESYALQIRDFSSDNFLFYNLGAGSSVNSYSSGLTRQTIESYTARLNYNLMDKYLFTLTGRYDGASMLAEGNKWAFFPSAAFAWRIADEGFMQSQHVVSDAKLRVSYGQTGNTGAGGGLVPLGTQSLLETDYTTIDDASVPALSVTGLANTDLTWERTSEINIGLDYGFINNRLYGSIDAYRRVTSDIIFSRPIPSVTGFTGAYDNIGETTNHGLEIALNAIIIDKDDFQWTTNLNFATNRNNITKLTGGQDDIIFAAQGATYIHRVGEQMGSIYSYEFDGIWQLDEAEEAAVYGQTPGQVKVKDLNDDGQITEEGDRKVIGTSTPKWTGGFTSTMNYKNFDFSFFVYANVGATALSNFHSAFSYAYDSEPARLWNGYDTDYWTPDNPTNEWYQPGNGGAYQAAIKYMDVSFVKVGYITLGYSLPSAFLAPAGIDRLRFYATIQNPFTFSEYDGWDPENASRNVWGGGFMSRTYMAGLNLTF